MAIVNVNLTLYKAKALVNLKYDSHVVKIGGTVDLRHDDAVDMSSRHLVKMIDPLEPTEDVPPVVPPVVTPPITPPPVDDNQNNNSDANKENASIVNNTDKTDTDKVDNKATEGAAEGGK